MPDQPRPGDRTVAQRHADHAGIARLTESLVPALVQKLNAGGLGELEVREGDWHVRLRRPAGSSRRQERPRHAATAISQASAMAHAPAPSHVAATSHPPAHPAPDPASDGPRRDAALAPAVGIFKPVAAPGTHVRAGDRIAIVDLLGIPQDVAAPIDGTVVEVYPQPGDGVEYGEEVALVEADPEPADGPAATAGEG
jgi:glutaconyl-CoA/methylmalonyl-CoA decarboxylase subunit gamma